MKGQCMKLENKSIMFLAYRVNELMVEIENLEMQELMGLEVKNKKDILEYEYDLVVEELYKRIPNLRKSTSLKKRRKK